MDEFDFEDAPPPSNTASLAASSHSYSQTLHDASPSRHPPSSSSSSLSSLSSSAKQSTSSSPARGRTKARRSRKVIRTGRDAKLAAVERFGDDVDNDNVKIVSKSRGGAAAKKQLNGAKRMDTPSSRDDNNDNNDTNNNNNNNSSSSSSASSVRIYGRRRKKQKMSAASTPKDYDSIDTFANDDHDYKLMHNMSFNHRDNNDTTASNTNNAEAAADTHSYFESPSRPNNNTNSKSVRFSLSSNDEHYYSDYGTPPSSRLKSGTPPEDTRKEENALNCHGGRRIEIHSSSQSHDSVIYESSTSEISSVGCTMKEEEDGDDADKEPSRKNRRECNNMNNNNNNNNNNKSSSPAKSSDHSASSYGSFRRKRKQRGYSYTANNNNSINNRMMNNSNSPLNNYNNEDDDDSEMYYSNSPKTTTVIALGQRDDIQDMGNYRMMIDDLSYLCSAILGCKKRVVYNNASTTKIVMERGHTAVTAGAACDLAQMISVSDIQTAMLILLGKGGGGKHHRNVGALSAVLEAVACVPPEGSVDDDHDNVTMMMEVCERVVTMGRSGIVRDGDTTTTTTTNNGVHYGDLKLNVSEKQPKSGAVIFGARTKNARRKQQQVQVSSNGNVTSNSKEVVAASASVAATVTTTSQTSSLIHRDKYHDDISSKALAIVSHVVSVLCTSKQLLRNDNPQISKRAMKSARDAVLSHKAALQGISRLVLNDPVVDAYLRREAVSSIHRGGEESILDANYVAIVDNAVKDSCPDDSGSAVSDEMKSDSGCKTDDPTKFGRRKGRKKKPSRLQQVLASSSAPLESISEIDGEDTEDRSLGNVSYTSNKTEEPQGGCSSDKMDSFSFASSNGTPSMAMDMNTGSSEPAVEPKRDTKYQKKIDSALSNAKLDHLVAKFSQVTNIDKSQEDDVEACPFCATWKQHLLIGPDDNENSSFPLLTSACLALDAADRVISGKDTSTSLEDGNDEEQHSDEDDSKEYLPALDEADDISNNPILYANEMMRKSGSLLNYSKSMSSTVVSLLVLFGFGTNEEKRKPNNCIKCITYLQNRASMLSVIIDNLCCLSPKVSRELSVPESHLIHSLLQTVSQFHKHIIEAPSSVLEDSVMNALKTLTTLSHENSLACEQIIKYSQSIHDDLKISMGLEIIFDCLIKTVTERPDHKFAYDTTIFCLNILTNVAEMMPTPTRAIFDELIVDDEKNGTTWLTQWIVSKTANFQQAVMKGSFGSAANTNSMDDHDDSELQSGEEGNLVTAGNGFILLSYLMLDEDNGTVTSKIRDNIINNLPLDKTGNSGGIQYMIKTLKAFCNFYHYSVGDLSVAVIAPVIKLISGLERLCLSQQKGNWL
eukprot:scaffold75397_cov67-Cyclotella_meneghiniana.AAC.3